MVSNEITFYPKLSYNQTITMTNETLEYLHKSCLAHNKPEQTGGGGGGGLEIHC